MVHLDEFEITVTDTAGTPRRIAVTFGDHCFTKDPSTLDPELVYPDSDKTPATFASTDVLFPLTCLIIFGRQPGVERGR